MSILIRKEGLYGLRGKCYEFDIIVSKSHADILEVKNRVAEVVVTLRLEV